MPKALFSFGVWIIIERERYKLGYCILLIEVIRYGYKKERKGEIGMNACVLKPSMPFVTKNKLERTPATEDNRKMVEFMDSHNFSFDVDKKSKTLRCTVTEK